MVDGESSWSCSVLWADPCLCQRKGVQRSMGCKHRDEVCLVHSRLAVPEPYKKREGRWRRSREVAKVRSGTYILGDISTSTSAGVVVNGNAEETHASYEYVLGRIEYK